MLQIKDVNAEYVIVGHSERRREHNERSEHIRRKVEAVIDHRMCAILCVGETEEERRNGQALKKVAQQLRDETTDTFFPDQLIVAYEPLWCIDSDRTPTQAQIEEMHGAIKYELQQLQPNGNLVSVLYGGSVNPKNATDILSFKNVDGVLVGRTGLKAEDLWAIVNASKK